MQKVCLQHKNKLTTDLLKITVLLGLLILLRNIRGHEYAEECLNKYQHNFQLLLFIQDNKYPTHI